VRRFPEARTVAELRNAIAVSITADALADRLAKVREALAEAKRECHRSGATRAWHAISRAEDELHGLGKDPTSSGR
jgi:hypothetical protein